MIAMKFFKKKKSIKSEFLKISKYLPNDNVLNIKIRFNIPM